MRVGLAIEHDVSCTSILAARKRSVPFSNPLLQRSVIGIPAILRGLSCFKQPALRAWRARYHDDLLPICEAQPVRRAFLGHAPLVAASRAFHMRILGTATFGDSDIDLDTGI